MRDDIIFKGTKYESEKITKFAEELKERYNTIIASFLSMKMCEECEKKNLHSCIYQPICERAYNLGHYDGVLEESGQFPDLEWRGGKRYE